MVQQFDFPRTLLLYLTTFLTLTSSRVTGNVSLLDTFLFSVIVCKGVWVW
jgi:hypothetical protein